MTWWHWLVIGLILVALEIAMSGGFYVIFFGIAALAIGALHALDIAGPLWFQFLLFSVLSVVSLVAFRNPLIRWLKLDAGSADVDSLVGETAMPLEDLPSGAVGRAELRGVVWTARNAGAATLPRGARCTVVGVDRLIILIKAEGAARV
jgi:membrane protein implicated in regulation of membrane protease activity